MKTILIALIFALMLPFYSMSNNSITTIPFQIVRNLVIVQASVNGKDGLFIIDTGVKDIILNNQYFTGKSTGEKFYGITGSEMEKEVNFIKMNLGGFAKQGFAVIADFSALENISGLNLYGVVGNSFFKNCEVVFDYTFQEVTIYQLDRKGNRLDSKYIHQNPLDTLSFTFENGIPYVEVNAKDRLLRMSVDSGATANVMNIKEMDQQNYEMIPLTDHSFASFGSKKVSVKTLSIDNLMVGNLFCPPMKTLFVNLDHINKSQSGQELDGILGYEFMSNFRVAINYRKKEIYLWNRDTVELQWALASKKKANNVMIKLFTY